MTTPLDIDIETLDASALRAYCAKLQAENTHLREMNEQHLNSQNQMEIVMRASKQGFWYWHSDTNESFYSKEYYQILGYEPNEFIPSYEQWVSFLHPEDIGKATKIQRRFVRGDIEVYDMEYRMRTKQGEYRWYLTKAGKVLKENGKVLLLGLVIDVTQHKLDEIALAQEKARLQLALKVAAQGIWDWDLENDMYYHSPNYYKLLGYNNNEIEPTYEFWVESIHPDDCEKAIQLEMDCMTGILDTYQHEYRMRTKEGDYQWYLCVTKVFKRGSDKQALRMIGVIQDINERKQVEIALKESEEKFRLLIEHNSASVSIFDTERYYYVNPRFLSTFGYTEAEIETLSPADIIHHIIEVEVNDSHKQPLPTGKKRRHNRYELKTITKTGETRWVDVTTLPIQYAGKRVNIATMYDITRRKYFEQEIREKNEELLASEEEMRQNAEELLAMNETLESAKSQLETLLETQQIVNAKVEKKSWELYKQKKEARQTLKKLQETQAHLIQSEKMASLGVLVAGVAHELNNPINYISTSAEGLQYSLDDIIDVLDKYADLTPQNIAQKLPEIDKLKKRLDFDDLVAEVKVLLDNIQTGANQTAEIVRGLRIFSRMEGGDFEAVNVHETLDQSLLILQNEYKYDMDMEKHYSSEPLFAEALTSKLGQVFVNIIKNAIDAIKMNPNGQKGKITVCTHLAELKEQAMIAIEIQDTGGGIPEETRKHIFEPFFTTKEVGKGTGLGLSISLGIIENFGGKIIVKSTIGEGTKFIVYLPPIRGK